MHLFSKATMFSCVLSTAVCAAQTSTPPAAPSSLPDAPGAQASATPVAPVPTGPGVVIDTSMGRLTCKLFAKESPLATANFIGLVEGTKTWTDPVSKEKVTGRSYYEGTTFHRVIPGFMIQGGDRAGDGSGDAGYYFDNESTPGLLFDQPGRLAMANAGPNTNGTQFFITEDAVPQLNGGYTIFGQCDAHSALLVASIARVERNASDKPRVPVVIKKIYIVREGAPQPPIPPGPANVVPDGKPPVGPPPAR